MGGARHRHVRQDVRAGVRGLRKSPGFALVAIGTLALGIGANTALFSIFSSLILRPLPVRDPGSLALLTNGSWSYPIWEEIRVRDSLFDGAFAWAGQSFDLSTSGESDLVDGAYVSGRLFDVLGVTAIRGRMITLADDRGAAPSFGVAQDAPSASRGADGPVAVISHRLWRQRFAGASDIVGRQLTVQRVPFTIVGVMPPGFFGPDVGRMTDVMLPFAAEPLIRGQESRLASRSSAWLQIMVRLRPGRGLEQTNAALRAAQPQIIEGATWARAREPLTLAPAATGRSSLRTRFETPLFAMVVAVGLVLLVACANIASLLLARALARRRELSVRLALGSSRWRIARLLFIESLIVAVTGAAFGLVFAKWSSALLVQQLSTWQSTVSLDLALDWRVLGFTAALACLSAITAGVAPVLGLKSVNPGEALKDAGRGIAGDRRFAVRSTLVVAQIAVSLVLVVAAGLFLRTFASLNRLPLGFVPEPLLVVELNLQASGGPPEAARCARRAPARGDGGGARRSLRVGLRDTAAHGSKRRLVQRLGRRRRWSDIPEPAAALAGRHDTRLVRDDGHPSARRPGLRGWRPRGRPSRCDRERSVRAPISAGRAAARAARASGIRSPTHATRSSAWSAMPSTRRRARACWRRCMYLSRSVSRRSSGRRCC